MAAQKFLFLNINVKKQLSFCKTIQSKLDFSTKTYREYQATLSKRHLSNKYPQTSKWYTIKLLH